MTVITNIKQHLIDRDVDLELDPVYLDEEQVVCVFPLYNLSGQWVGYQRYNPNGPKGNHSRYKHLEKPLMKYQSRITKWDRKEMLAVYGLHTYNKDYPNLFLVEGIFDCIKLHRLGHPAIAVIANDPKHLRSWLMTLPQRKIVICDRDENEAGNKLRKYGDFDFTVPEPYGDLGDMELIEIRRFINTMDCLRI